MGKVFEVGKIYARSEGGYDPLMVVGRTEKTIVCRHAFSDSCRTFRMKIHIDEDRTEFVYDSYVPLRHRDGTVCNAEWEVTE